MARVRLAGPWRGMDLRDNGAADGTARLFLNMENRSGVMKPRQCYQSVYESLETNAQLHFVDRPGLQRVILAVGGVSGGKVRVDGLDEWGNAIFTNKVLTTEALADPRIQFRCSFIDTFLRPVPGIVVGPPRPVTLIVTPNATWVYEPLADATTVRLASIADDAVQANTNNINYLVSLPRGPIAVSHGSYVFYAGFQDGVDVMYDSPLDDDQADVPPSILAQNRSSLRLSPGLILHSDEHDPLGIGAFNFEFLQNEIVTGLHSAGEVLLVFTANNIYALSGYNFAKGSLQLIVRGTGCVSHWSIVTVDGVTYFASDDGIYAFGGMGAPEAVKISEGLSPLWDGWDGQSTFVPDPMAARLASFGWPWTVKTDLNHMICGRYRRQGNQIWWSVATTGPWNFNVINAALVLDLETRGFSLFFMDPTEAIIGPGSACIMSDAVEANGKWYTSNSLGYLLAPTSSGWDGLSIAGLGLPGVPAFFLSQRIAPVDADWKKVLDTRVKLLSRGLYASVYGGDASDALGSGGVPKDLPYFCLSGEAEAFDVYLDTGAAATYSERGSTCTGKLKLIPHDGLPTLDGVGASGPFTINTSKWVAKDWFSSRCEGQIGAKAFRFGLVDDAWANTRGPKMAVVAIEFDVLVEGTTHR